MFSFFFPFDTPVLLASCVYRASGDALVTPNKMTDEAKKVFKAAKEEKEEKKK
jgi:hypothetical protein